MLHYLYSFLIGILSHLFPAQNGSASYYADRFEGRKTFSGEIFHHNLYTAAHRTLPIGAVVLVSTPQKYIIVKINDRMGKSNHIIDLTSRGSEELGFRGHTNVEIRRIL